MQKYDLTPADRYLLHYGVKGMKWGKVKTVDSEYEKELAYNSKTNSTSSVKATPKSNTHVKITKNGSTKVTETSSDYKNELAYNSKKNPVHETQRELEQEYRKSHPKQTDPRLTTGVTTIYARASDGSVYEKSHEYEAPVKKQSPAVAVAEAVKAIATGAWEGLKGTTSAVVGAIQIS